MMNYVSYFRILQFLFKLEYSAHNHIEYSALIDKNYYKSKLKKLIWNTYSQDHCPSVLKMKKMY